MGSPPHLWGIQHKDHLGYHESRITPTPVGNTLKKRRHTGILFFKKCRFPLTCFSSIPQKSVVHNEKKSPTRKKPPQIETTHSATQTFTKPTHFRRKVRSGCCPINSGTFSSTTSLNSNPYQRCGDNEIRWSNRRPPINKRSSAGRSLWAPKS